jgi:branched-chain amino acid transport system substrate-binding protein
MPSKKLVILVVFAILLLGCAEEAPEVPEETPTGAPTEEVTEEVTEQPPPEEVEIPIGVLVDLSGPLTTYGEDIRDLLKIGESDINTYFEENGKPYKIKFYVEDTRVDPKIALDKVQALHGKGVRLFVGPMGSGEVKNIAAYLNDNKLIVISPSSTALPPLLGVTKPEEKKYIFRFVATDDFQTKAIASEAASLGIKAVVIVNVGNAWGKGLADYGKPEFENQGIEVKSIVEYPDPPPADFTSYIETVEGDISELLETYNATEIALVAFSYEEIYTFLSQVADDSVLMDIMWLGCDGTAKSRQISEMCDDVNKVKMYSTLFESKGDAYEQVNETYFNEFGKTPYQYALDAYDGAWVLALSFAQVYDTRGEYDPDEMAATIPEVTVKYSEGEYGMTPVSGYITLNEWNDRASGDYAIWGVEDCNWVLEGIWSSQTNEVTWE